MVKRSSSNMKKIYEVPALQVNEAQVESLMAVSVLSGEADSSKEVLTKEEVDWDLWADEE